MSQPGSITKEKSKVNSLPVWSFSYLLLSVDCAKYNMTNPMLFFFAIGNVEKNAWLRLPIP